MKFLQKLFSVKDHEGRRVPGAHLKELYQKIKEEEVAIAELEASL